MFRPDYPLRTERLLLRPFEEDDIDDFHAYRSLPEVQRYLYSEPHTLQDSQDALTKQITQTELTEDGQGIVVAVYLPERERVIGEVGLTWTSREHRQGEAGYIFHPDFHGKGYAREATEVMLKLGFGDLGLHRIIARCEPRNEPSWRLMERLGFRREAHFRHCEIFKGEWGDTFVYALLADEWE